jgi:deoxyribose-phosphate aldolase
MDKIEKIARKIFKLEGSEPSRSGGAHVVSLHSIVDRSDYPPQIADYKGKLNDLIDHTILNPNATSAEVIKKCEEADKYHFASICLQPCWVELATEVISNSIICTVTGFPLGANNSKTKAFEAALAIEEGAKEIDMVLNIGQLKSGNYDLVYQDIAIVSETCLINMAILKVIIETCLLTEEEKIIACLLAKKAGADFVKTSTGFSTGGATIEDIYLMRRIVGDKMGVKAAGGIRDENTARSMIKAGANRIGASNGIKLIDHQLQFMGV